MSLIKKIVTFIVRLIYLVIGLFFMYMEKAANWTISYNNKTEYIKKGECKKCGKCCKVLAVQYPKFFDRLPWLINLTIKWHGLRYSFAYLSKEGSYLLYECKLPSPDGRCSCYWMRPRLCREYPKMGLYGRPFAHFGCGFYFVRRDGRPTFDEALHKAGKMEHLGSGTECSKMEHSVPDPKCSILPK